MSEHLSPESFVDVLDGAPVDAPLRLHLEGCARCRAELRELEQTLSLLNDEGIAAPPLRRMMPAWAVAAAAVLVTAFAVSFFLGGRPAPDVTTSVELEGLLPPVEEDQEFQLLQALSDASNVEPAEIAELAGVAFDGLTLDPSPLTPGERQRFVERLTEEMRSSL